MMGRPTFREYLLSNRSGYTRSKDGWYFADASSKALHEITKSVFVLIIIAMLIADFVFSIELKTQTWFDFSGTDLALCIFILAPIGFFTVYRLSRFRRLDEGTEEYNNAVNQKRHPKLNTMRLTFNVLLFIFLLSFSTPAAYAYSLFVPPSTDISVNTDSNELVYSENGSANGTAVVVLPAEYDSAPLSVGITTRHEPSPLQLNLNGYSLDVIVSRFHNTGWPWNGFFSQHCRFNIPSDAVPDGSTLTLTCGDLYREWVFDMKDEEAS